MDHETVTHVPGLSVTYVPGLYQGRYRPSKKPQSWNRYVYSHNNPLKFIDPNGQDPIQFISGKRDNSLRLMLVNLAMRPGGRAALTKIAETRGFNASVENTRFRDNNLAKMAALRSAGEDVQVHGGRTTPIVTQGSGATGAQVEIDTLAVNRFHEDTSGVVTTGHELAKHVGDLIDGVAPSELGDDELGAEAVGRDILDEEPDFTKEEAEEFLEKVVKDFPKV